MAQIIVRLTLSSNAIGPYSIYVDSIESEPIHTGITRDQLVAGLPISLPAHGGGVEYKIIIQNNQDGCQDTIVKNIVLYDETPAPTPSTTQTPKPTITPTVTSTSTVTPTVTPSISTTPLLSPSQTPTITPTPSISNTPQSTTTPTPTPSIQIDTNKAYLLIEPQSLGMDILDHLTSRGVSGSDFYGFTFTYLPTTTNSLKYYMEMFANNTINGLVWYELDIPQYGTNQYLFNEIIIPASTINENAWYTFFIPEESMGGSQNRLTQIEQGTSPSYGYVIDLESTVYNFGPISYDGPVFENKNYRVYTSWVDQSLRLNNFNDTLYFKGKKIN